MVNIIQFSLCQTYLVVVSIEKVPKGTDINFPKEDNSDSATRFKLPQKALESLSGILSRIENSKTEYIYECCMNGRRRNEQSRSFPRTYVIYTCCRIFDSGIITFSSFQRLKSNAIVMI